MSGATAEAINRGAVLRIVAAHLSGTPRRSAERVLRDASDLTSGVDVEWVVSCGEAVDVLVTHSSRADLLVVGGHHNSEMSHSVMGGVGDSCARLVGCPVVIVPNRSARTFVHAGTDHETRVPPSAA